MKKKTKAIVALSDSEIKNGKCPVHISSNENGSKLSIQLLKQTQKNYSANDQYEAIIQGITGTKDTEQSNEIIDRAIAAMPKNLGSQHNINAIYQTLANFQPQDAIEAKLCVKEASLYAVGMNYLKRAQNEENLCLIEKFMTFAIKLLRLQNETVEAISRYRRKGEQKVMVQHQYVNVENGGKAIVGALMTGEGAKMKSNEVTPC